MGDVAGALDDSRESVRQHGGRPSRAAYTFALTYWTQDDRPQPLAWYEAAVESNAQWGTGQAWNTAPAGASRAARTHEGPVRGMGGPRGRAWLCPGFPGLTLGRSEARIEWMKAPPRATVVGLVTPHLLRIIDLANQAEKGMNVDWHLRDAVATSMKDLGDLWNAPASVAAYLEGLENAAAQAPKHREAYVRVLQAAADSARRLRRD
ncbi:hypothetical protein [Lysobacter sp. A3-1-A15]